MLGLCFDETYSATKNYNGGYDEGDNDGNKDRNNDDNSASILGYNGPIFGPITTPWSRREGSGDHGDGESVGAVTHYVSTRRIIYLPYKDHIKDVL